MYIYIIKMHKLSLDLYIHDIALNFGFWECDVKNTIVKFGLDVVLVNAIRKLEAGVVGRGVLCGPALLMAASVLMAAFDNQEIVLNRYLDMFFGEARHVETHLDFVFVFFDVPWSSDLSPAPHASWPQHCCIVEQPVYCVQHLPHCPHWR